MGSGGGWNKPTKAHIRPLESPLPVCMPAHLHAWLKDQVHMGGVLKRAEQLYDASAPVHPGSEQLRQSSGLTRHGATNPG